VGDAVAAGLLVALSVTLALLSAQSFARHRKRAFVALTVGFSLILLEGVGISLIALSAISSTDFPILAIAGLQAAALVLIYAATLPAG